VFTTTPGADGATTAYGLTITGGNGTASGLLDAQTGSSIVLVNNAGVIEGHVATTGGALAFTLSVAANGDVTLTQDRSVKEGVGEAGDISEGASITGGIVNLVATATDGDGDTATKSYDLGAHVTFNDDGPIATADTNSASAEIRQPSWRRPPCRRTTLLRRCTSTWCRLNIPMCPTNRSTRTEAPLSATIRSSSPCASSNPPWASAARRIPNSSAMAHSGRSKYVVSWPAFRPVAPRPTRSRSTSSTLWSVSRRVKNATARPAIPAPTITTPVRASPSSGLGGPSGSSWAIHGDLLGCSTYATPPDEEPSTRATQPPLRTRPHHIRQEHSGPGIGSTSTCP